MARLRSPEKRKAILEAAVEEIATAGLGAATAKIAERAGVATGTLFTYFASKEALLNELYLELKDEVYTRINADFPHRASLEKRARHVWITYLDWAIEFPAKRRASVQLNVSDVLMPETRLKAAQGRALVDTAMAELGERLAARGLPKDFAGAAMSAMQEATMEFIAKAPRQRSILTEQGFAVYWRAMR
jgi:AcrR family transcriptional regulator